MSIADKLVTIAENEPKVFHAGQLKTLAEAECLNGRLQGTTVKANDVENIEHNIPCRVESKNLFEFKQGVVSGNSGVQLIESLDNGAICQGVISSDTQNSGWANGWYTFANRATTNLKAGDVVTVSCDYTVLELAEGHSMDDFNSNEKKKIGLHLYHTSGTNSLAGLPQNPPTVLGEPTRLYITYTVKADGEYYPIFTLNSNKVRVENIQIEYGSTATPYTPYITDFNGIEVKRYSKNLWDNNNVYKGYIESKNGELASQNSDALELTSDFIPCAPSIIYTMQSILTTISGSYQWVCLAFYDKDKNFITRIANYGVAGDIAPFSVSSSAQNNAAYVRASARTFGYDNAKLQLEIGSATNYEPYAEPQTATATADGIVDGITSIAPNMTLLTNVDSVIINANYYKDPDIVISNLQQAVAMSGGE